MPVYTRAPRPVVFPLANPRRDTSDNDFTVLFDRNAARGITERSPPPGESSRLNVERTSTFERPSRFERPAPPRIPERYVAPLHPAPPSVAVAVPAAPPRTVVPTVIVRASARTQFLRAMTLLALGSISGVAVELLMPGRTPDSSAFVRPEVIAPVMPARPIGASAAPSPALPPPQCGPPAALAAASTSAKTAALPAPHHHVHHASAAVADPAGDATPDEPDDLSAAMKTLTQSKEEVTIP
jgi:hypothetical protein